MSVDEGPERLGRGHRIVTGLVASPCLCKPIPAGWASRHGAWPPPRDVAARRGETRQVIAAGGERVAVGRRAASAVLARAHLALLPALAVLLQACTLSSEQLSLPGAMGGPTKGSEIGAAAQRPGVRTSNPADDETREPRLYPGSVPMLGASNGGAGAGRPARAEATSSETGDGVMLNLAGASIQELASTVLGDVLKVNYAVAEGVKGSITLKTVNPIPRQDLLATFESLIRAEGAALVVENGLYRIVAAEGGGAAGIVRRGRAGGTAGLGNEIIPLRYVAAEEMQRILTSLAPQSSVVKVDQNRNILIASGTANELASIRETVATFDVDWMRGMSFGLFPVESGDPEAIAQELDTIFANDRESPVKGVVRFVPNKRLKSVLVISARPEYLRKAETWIKRIDLVGQESEKQVQVYHVQNRPARELAELLQKVYTPSSERAGDQPVAALPPGSQPATLSSDPARPLTTQDLDARRTTSLEPRPLAASESTPFATPPQPGGKSRDAASAATTVGSRHDDGSAPIETGSLPAGPRPHDLDGTIKVVADEANNALIITASMREYKRVRQILSRIDVAASQVLLEATIAEVSLNDQLRFGLRWFFESQASQFRLTDSVLGAVAPRFPGFSYFLNMPNVQVALNALSDVTDVNVVSSPSMMVLDNKQALLQIGDEVPIATQSAVAVGAPGAPIVNSVSFRSTGVILGITPRIGDNGRVLLDIEQEVSDVVPTTSSTIDSPTIQQRRIKTTVAVQSGESIVLAGFMQDRARKARQQVPLVGDVPWLGNLFKDKDDQIRRTELLIAITPQIVKDPHQIRGIAAEFRDRINLTTRPQRRTPPDRREQIDRVLVR